MSDQPLTLVRPLLKSYYYPCGSVTHALFITNSRISQIPHYSTAQLQGNVRTRLKRVQDASGTHVRRVHASAKPCNKAATRRTRVPRPFFARRWARPERVWNASETRANVTLELSCTVTLSMHWLPYHTCTCNVLKLTDALHNVTH